MLVMLIGCIFSNQAEDQIKIFLSYAQLKDVLRDDFKKRLGK